MPTALAILVLLATAIAPVGLAVHPSSNGGGGGGGGGGGSSPTSNYTLTFDEQGLPAGLQWGIQFAGQSHYSVTGAIVFSNVSGGTYQYAVLPPTGYATSTGSTTLVVASDLRISVPFSSSSAASPNDQLTFGSWPPGGLELTLIGAILGVGGAAVVGIELMGRRRRRRAATSPEESRPPGSD